MPLTTSGSLPPSSLLAGIDDNALYTGRELKSLLRVLSASNRNPLDRWIDLDEAADLIGCKPDTLRKRCARWALHPDPVVRVTKKGSGASSHWLLLESDVRRLARLHTVNDNNTQTAAPTPAAESAGQVAIDHASDGMWLELVTRDL
jgi:hypothetical protein